MRLGARIVRELELEQSVDTLGRWMAHHLAEVMQEAESAEGGDKELARESAVDLILKLWSHKQSLPNGAYPLNDLKTVMSVVGQLSAEDSPFSRRSSDETEKLLARIFDGLRLVVAHSVILISETRGIPDDLDAVAPFLEEDERQLIEVVEGWIDILTEDEKADWDSKQAEMAELKQLDPKSRSGRIFSRKIDGLIEALSDLKLKLASEDPESNKEE